MATFTAYDPLTHAKGPKVWTLNAIINFVCLAIAQNTATLPADFCTLIVLFPRGNLLLTTTSRTALQRCSSAARPPPPQSHGTPLQLGATL